MSKTLPFSVMEGRLYSIPLSTAIAADVTLSGSGTEKTGLCPFHKDKHKGSFMVNDKKGCWKCFSCGEGGKGAASFVMKLYELDYKTAVNFLANRLGLASDDTMQQYAPKNAAGKTKHITDVSAKLPPDQLDLVYRIFIECAGPMTDEFWARLKEERHLRDEDKDHFFAAPAFSPEFMSQMAQKLEDHGLNPNQVLAQTPGFYFEMRNKRFRFQKLQPGTLGIKCFDSKGRISGIQFRRDTTEMKKRYVWFSSGFADGSYGCSNGTVNSGVVDVLPGSRKELVCTEGKFKALALSREGYTVLNMHGITTWPGEKVAKFASMKGFEQVLLCYDADILRNDSVARAALKFSSELARAGIKFQYMTWDERNGKGYDDLVNNGGQATLADGPAFNEKELRNVIELG